MQALGDNIVIADTTVVAGTTWEHLKFFAMDP